MKIGILETGKIPEELLAAHGEYPAMYENWLAPLNGRFTTYSVLNGEMPDNPHEQDLWLITGSKFGAYEDHDWIPPLEEFIRDCCHVGRKFIGICFGHQIIAQALGGKAEKSTKGWGLGVHDYTAINWPENFGPAPEKLSLQAVHQDQVTQLPRDAIAIMRSDFCENAAIWYPGFALTVQGHPEYPMGFARDLLDFRRGTVYPESIAVVAEKTLDYETSNAELALFIRNHLSDI